MLTLKAPIEIKSRTDFIKDRESFNERITGNYALMGMEIGPEELLHIVTTPPEIYVAEGEMTTVAGNTVINSRNEEKLNIINNALNRILVSVDTPLTYQDRTYITDVLYKLGIRDDRKFMNEVRRIFNETQLTDRFLNDYFIQSLDDNAEEVRRETLELSREIVERGLSDLFTVKENYLGEEIMQRLQTGAIYQIVANFNRSVHDSRIEGDQYHISEQENTAKQLLINNFLNTMEREGAEIILREEGEGYIPGEEEGTETERLTERYTEGGREIERRESRYDRESSTRSERETVSDRERLLRSEELIFKEEAAAGPEGDTASGEEIREKVESLEERERIREREELRERSERERILSESREAEREEIRSELVYREGESPSAEEAPEDAERERISPPGTEERERVRERETIERLRERLLSSEEVPVTESRFRERTELIYREEGRSAEGESPAEIAVSRDYRELIRYRSDNIYERELTEERSREVPVTEEVTAAVFMDMVKNLYRSGYERIRQGDSWFDIRNVLFRSSENTFNRVSFQADSSYYDMDITDYRLEAPVNIENLEETEVEGDVYEGSTIENNIRQLTRINEKNIKNLERYQQMMEVLRATERTGRKEGGRDRTRRDALRALEGNEDIRELFTEEDEQREERRERVFHEIERLFPDNTREVFNIIERYLENPGEAGKYAGVINNNLAEAAEEIRKFQERAESREIETVVDTDITGEELVFRRNESLTQEDIEEAVNNIRNNTSRTRETIENNEVIRERQNETVKVVNTQTERFSMQQLDDITDMVNRGVKSQMNTISEQVLQKLEKRLRNEKSRRGI